MYIYTFTFSGQVPRIHWRMKDAARKIMSRVMTNDLVQRFNWNGRKKSLSDPSSKQSGD